VPLDKSKDPGPEEGPTPPAADSDADIEGGPLNARDADPKGNVVHLHVPRDKADVRPPADEPEMVTKMSEPSKPAEVVQDSGTKERLAKLEGSYDALKVVRPMTITVLGVLLAALIFVLSFMASELRDLNTKQQTTDAKIDAIPAKLADEFRAMRSEMAAQTNAIANSITAARQFQPQVVVVPAPTLLTPPASNPAPEPQAPH
jgi:hypothetical protein